MAEMRSKFLWGIFVTILLVGGSGVSSLVMAQTPDNGGLKLLTSNDQEIVLELSVPDFQVETIAYGGQSYQRLLIPEMAQTHSPGDPQVPIRGVFLGVPSTEGVSVEVVEFDYETLSGYRLYPAPALELVGDDITAPSDIEGVREVFTLNQDRYATDAFYSGGLAEIGETGFMRDQAVARIHFYPVQYNPVSGEIRLYTHIQVRITWDTQLSGLSMVEASPDYERVLQGTLLNYDTLDRPPLANKAFSRSLSADGMITSTGAGDKFKIGVTEDGIQKITPADVPDFIGVNPNSIKIKNKGSEIPIYVHDVGTADTFEGNDYILFYGTAMTDIYAVENVYWLESSSGSGQRVTSRSGAGSATLAQHFPVTLHAETDSNYVYYLNNNEGQDYWFWGDRINNGDFPEYPLMLQNRSSTATTATIRVHMRGWTIPHDTQVYLNGTQVGSQTWNGQITHTLEIDIPHSNLIDGANTIGLRGNASVDQFFLNWIEIDYWDTYVAESNRLFFGAPAAGTFTFQVTNFDSDDIEVFDITNPVNPIRIIDTSITSAGGGKYTLEFMDSPSTNTRYLALSLASIQSPSLKLDDTQISSTGADYIIITHDEFEAAAQTLATYRSGVVVNIEDIYDEYNYGIANPQAVRDFLTDAYQQWNSTYVLLLGAGTYDYRGVMGWSGRGNFVPTQFVLTDLGETASDNWFVLVSGDDNLPDMFIGRLTPQTAAEATDMVNKIMDYDLIPSTASWKTNVLLVADDGNPDDGDNDPKFENMSDDWASILPHYYTANKVYLLAGQPDPPNPTQSIINYINNGSLLVSYAGHGNRDFWAQEKIFGNSDIPTLNNANKFPVVIIANCLNGFFVGSKDSMAEEFMKTSNKGAVAVWAPTGLGYSSGHEILMGEFYDLIFQQDKYSLGEVTTLAKIATYNQTGGLYKLTETFVLFGDPAIQLGGPAQETGSESVFLPIVIKND